VPLLVAENHALDLVAVRQRLRDRLWELLA
jgi:hypothetical protein